MEGWCESDAESLPSGLTSIICAVSRVTLRHLASCTGIGGGPNRQVLTSARREFGCDRLTQSA
jgi:hypothetical protein